MTFEQLLQRHRSYVDHLVARLARRHYLSVAEMAELRAQVEGALERNDYELLRAFDGRCTWESYFSTVVTREFFLFQASLWGQWRPSPTANRLGAAAVLLEELVARDGMPVDKAADLMRTTHRVDLPKHRIIELAARLRLERGPRQRGEPRPAPEEVAVPKRVELALREALRQLPADDRLILELRFRDRQPLTRIAAILRTDVRPIERRIDSAKRVIRTLLLEQGMATHDVEVLLQHADSDTPYPDQRWWHAVLSETRK